MVFFVEAITILNTVTFCAFFLPLRRKGNAFILAFLARFAVQFSDLQNRNL